MTRPMEQYLISDLGITYLPGSKRRTPFIATSNRRARRAAAARRAAKGGVK